MHVQQKIHPLGLDRAKPYFLECCSGSQGSKVADMAVNSVYFDLETQRSAADVGGWGNKHLMRVSFAVTYSTREACFRGFEEDDMPALLSELSSADRVIGYNLLGFDYAVMSAYTDNDLSSLPTLDLMADLRPILGFRPKLENLAQATLGSGKTAEGLQAVRWYQEGRFADIAIYCKEDVRITRDLHLFGCKNKFIYCTDKTGQSRQVSVDW